MGSFLSLPLNKTETRKQQVLSQMESCKRLRMSMDCSDGNPRLIPSLPDEIYFLILARLPRICYRSMRLLSRSWKSAITSLELSQFRKELGTTEEWLYLLTKVEDDKLFWHAVDPLYRKWQRLPPMPMVASREESKNGLIGFQMWNVMGASIKMADVIIGWLGWKDACDRLLLSGYAVGAVDDCLYVLGGLSKASALKNVWRYDPRVNSWEEMSSMTTGRAFCKAGLINNKLYVAGGVSRDKGSFSPLCYLEAYDPCTGQWAQLSNMPFMKAVYLPTAFLADMLKPMATGMTIYNGRLYVPQSVCSWPFFIGIGGEIYDPETDSWSDMPTGIGDGWPVWQSGTKFGAVVDRKLYALEPSSGIIKIYDDGEDAWKDIAPKVPLRDFTESESPFLLDRIIGKLHVITNR